MVLSLCVHQVKQLIMILVGLVRRALCCFKRRRKSDAQVVPLATIGVIPDRQADQPQMGSETWDNWGRGNTVREQIEDYRFRQQVKQVSPVSELPPQFYFQDMEPEIKAQAKLLLKTKEDEMESPSRLSLVSDVRSCGAELESWEESNAGTAGWEEAENWNVGDKIKEGRRPLGVKLS